MATNTSQQRDMVFCHECENEWYRDEHGLSCPECRSDFTEIIEPQHDPREEIIQQDDDFDEIEHHQNHPLHDHNPWEHEADAPDPDEGDISNFGWRQNGPGSMSFTGSFTRTLSPNGQLNAPQGQAQQQQFPPLMQNFATMLNGMLGGTAQQQQQQPMQGGQQTRGVSNEVGSLQPIQQNQPFQQNGPRVQITRGQGPGFSYTMSTSTRLVPRDANGPQPQGQPQINLPDLLNQMFQAPRNGAQQGAGPFAEMGPLGGLFAGLLNPANMQHGDAVYSQEALDRIVSQLMEQNQTGNAPGPATAEAIARLPQKSITESDFDDGGKAECTICMDEVKLGDEVSLLPCGHWFHGDCIKAWLGEHDTCPHCRQGIMPKDGPPDASAPRAPDEAPRHTQAWGQGEGTRTNPYTVPDSPTQQRPPQQSRRSSSSAGPSNSSGLFGRMRDAFGGGSSGSQR